MIGTYISNFLIIGVIVLKKKNNFNEKLYGVYDKVSNSFSYFFQANSNGLACRKAMLSLAVPLRDTDLYYLGNIIDNSISSISPVLVSWDSYKLPENIAEALDPLHCSPEELSEIAKSMNK